MTHTPIPWFIFESDDKLAICGKGGDIVTDMTYQSKADADLIVAAVNNHAEMLAALKRFMEYGNVYCVKPGETTPYEDAKQIIQKVEG